MNPLLLPIKASPTDQQLHSNFTSLHNPKMNYSFSHFLLLFLLTSLSPIIISYVSSTNHHPPHPQPNSMDPSELQTLFKIMETLSSDQTWSISYPNPCKPGSSWVGIECKPGITDPYLHVTRLDFGTPPNPSCKNSSTFPPQIFLLPYLQSIFFIQCFTKTRTTLSLLPKGPPSLIQQLSLRSNPSLVGSIPPQIFSHLNSLQILTLSQNHLSGPIPTQISNLTSLVHLDLSYNLLTGPIPHQLFNLQHLVGLDLSYNSLTDSIPDTIGQLVNLQKLDLSSNSLTGPIPNSVQNLNSLAFIALSNNKFHGNLPNGLEKLKSLEYFIMDDNPMFVTLPPVFDKLLKLQELHLANSGYSGSIPPTFSKLTNLTTLSLQNNRLSGEIPIGFGNLSHIYHMNLSRNMLGGRVPFSSSFFNRLGRNLDVSGNPDLCLNPSEEAYAINIGVDYVCGSNKTSSTMIIPLKKSQASSSLDVTSTSFTMFCALGVLAFHNHIHIFYLV